MFKRPDVFGKSFEERQSQFDRRFNLIWKVVWGGIILTVILVVLQYVAVGYFVSANYETVKQNGVKGVLERVWYGERGQDQKLPEK
jgi:hypothetical protein